MNNRFIIMLIIALTLAGGAAWIAKNWVDSQSELKQEDNIVPIVVAAIEIPYGTKIDQSHVKLLGWPKEHLPKGVFTDINKVMGKVTQRAFITDEVLLEPQIKEKLEGSILSAQITEGKRAISVRVDDVAGVAGFITPGNMVDIIATNNKDNKTYILLSNVKVLAIDQVTSPTQEKPSVVRALTIEVTVEESKSLVKAMQNGPLYFTLRNTLDERNVEEKPLERPAVVEVQGSKEEKYQPVKPALIAKPKKKGLTIIDWPMSGQKQSKELEKNDEK